MKKINVKEERKKLRNYKEKKSSSSKNKQICHPFIF